MPKEHRVRQGDCILSIAAQEGFFWQTIWDHGDNSELKERRGDPNLLYPGDVVTIPDKETKEESGATETTHRFVKKGMPAKFRIVVEQDDRPVKNTDYVLTVDGKVYEGQTDEQGLIEVNIDPGAKEGTLEVGDLSYDLDFGAMDPLEETTGVQSRLQNLGFYHGALDGEVGPETQEAIAEFQATVGLEATGELNDETKRKLYERQDEEHEELEEDEGPGEEYSESASDEETVDDEDVTDGNEEEEEQQFAEDSSDSPSVQAGEEDIELPEDESDEE
jgi:hypothetical protein